MNTRRLPADRRTLSDLYAPPENERATARLVAPDTGALPPHVARELATALAFAAGFFCPDFPDDVDEAVQRGEAARLNGHPTRTTEAELHAAYDLDAARRYGKGGTP